MKLAKTDALQSQLVDIAINTRSKATDGGTNPALLPYDPNNAPDALPTFQIMAPNLLDNTDFDQSKANYMLTAGADDAYECFGWFRQRFIKLTDVATTATSNAITSASALFVNTYTYPMAFMLFNGGAAGATISGYLNRNGADNAALLYSDVGMTTPLNVSSTMTSAQMWFGDILDEVSAQAMKYSSHSLWAANENANTLIPRWDNTNGWIEFGSNASETWALSAPLPVNAIRPGITYYFRCITALRVGTTIPDPVRIGVGIWDASASVNRFLESDTLELTVTPVGTTGATTYYYRIIADLDDGTSVASNLVTVANGNATLSTSNYNRLTWENAPGILNFRIYREVAGVVKRVFTITNGSHDFNDVGTDEGETPVSMPSTNIPRPVAYRTSAEFTLTNDTGTSWRTVKLRLEIPSTYNMSTTTGKLWIRLALEGDTNDVRAVCIDRAMLSTSDAGWQLSNRDNTMTLNQTPTSTPAGSAQGGTGVENCFDLDTLVIVCEKDGTNLRKIRIGDIDRGMYVASGSRKVFRVMDILPAVSPVIWSVNLDNGIQFKCSPSERFITSRADIQGTRIDDLTIGDDILCWMNGRVETAKIDCIGIAHTDTPIRTLKLKGGHTFVVGQHPDDLCGAIAHNRKEPPDSGIETGYFTV